MRSLSATLMGSPDAAMPMPRTRAKAARRASLEVGTVEASDARPPDGPDAVASKMSRVNFSRLKPSVAADDDDEDEGEVDVGEVVVDDGVVAAFNTPRAFLIFSRVLRKRKARSPSGALLGWKLRMWFTMFVDPEWLAPSLEPCASQIVSSTVTSPAASLSAAAALSSLGSLHVHFPSTLSAAPRRYGHALS